MLLELAFSPTKPPKRTPRRRASSSALSVGDGSPVGKSTHPTHSKLGTIEAESGEYITAKEPIQPPVTVPMLMEVMNKNSLVVFLVASPNLLASRFDWADVLRRFKGERGDGSDQHVDEDDVRVRPTRDDRHIRVSSRRLWNCVGA